MKRWIGRWLVAVSIGHVVLAIVAFRTVLAPVLERGLVHAVGGDPRTQLAVWFVLFGVMLFICGLSIDALERASSNRVPKFIGWCLLALGALGAALMPVSGFWLVFPPAIAVLARKSSSPLAAART